MTNFIIKEQASNFILLKEKSDTHKISFSNILFIKSNDKKIIVNSLNNVLEYYYKISDIEDKLGKMFFRCHRCFIINLDYVVGYNSSVIRMKNGKEIPVPQKKYSRFKEKYITYIKNKQT